MGGFDNTHDLTDEAPEITTLLVRQFCEAWHVARWLTGAATVALTECARVLGLASAAAGGGLPAHARGIYFGACGACTSGLKVRLVAVPAAPTFCLAGLADEVIIAGAEARGAGA